MPRTAPVALSTLAACAFPLGVLDPEDVEIVVLVSQAPYESALPPAVEPEPTGVRFRGTQEIASGVLEVRAALRHRDGGGYTLEVVGTQVRTVAINPPRDDGLPYPFLYEVILGNLPPGRYPVTVEEFHRGPTGESFFVGCRQIDVRVR